MIVDAKINLHLTHNDLYQNEYIELHNVTESWSTSTVSWANQPAYEQKTTDYLCLSPSSDIGRYSWDITKLAKGWLEGETNNGFMLKSKVESGTNIQAVEFYSSSYTLNVIPRPIFQIIYCNNKGIEDYWSYTTVGAGGAGTIYVNDYSGALTLVTPIASTTSPAKSASLSYIYNSYMAGVNSTTYKPYVGN